MKSQFLSLSLLLLSTTLLAQPTRRTAGPRTAVPIIFDTDMGPDYDDAGAITLLHALADSGLARPLATVASCRHSNVAATLSVFNTFFRRPTVPIGVVRGPAVTDADRQHWTDTLVARYPHALRSNDVAEDAVTLYRRILARQPDRSVTVVTVGFMTNLANLLRSPADKLSPLTGRDLVRRKVKQLVSMAGMFPAGYEFNVHRDAEAARYAFAEWPTPVLLSGFEIGRRIKTGLPLVQNVALRNHPTKDVFRISIPLDPADKEGRMSWDQTAVLVAILGVEPFYSLKTGRITIDKKGNNGWDATGTGHAYLVEKLPVPDVTALIDRLMQHRPKR